MTDTLRDRIAKVADTHTAMGYDSDYGPNDSWVCNCGWSWTAGGTHGEHVADAVIEELGLRQEYDPYSEPESSRRRYVTEWENNDE